MPAIPAALRELAATAPLYVETAICREVRWSPETGPLGKLPGPRARKTTPKTTQKKAAARKTSKPTTTPSGKGAEQ